MLENSPLKIWMFLIAIACAFAAGCPRAEAHPLAPSLLEIGELSPGQVQVLWKTPLARVPGEELQPSLPPFCHPVGAVQSFMEGSAKLSRSTVACDSAMVGSSWGVQGFANLQSHVILRLSLADGRKYQKVLDLQNPSFIVPEHPQASTVFKSYFRLGLEHILSGWDHLLFVLGLVLLVSSRRALLWTVSAFTLGHSVTLSLAALGLIHVPPLPVEALIAFSIVLLAIELTRSQAVHKTFFHRYPWALAFSFGLLHGLGFAGALAEVGLPPGEIPLALFSFNVGIELGQLAFIALVLMGQWALSWAPKPLTSRSRGLAVYAIGCLSAFWLIERLSKLL